MKKCVRLFLKFFIFSVILPLFIVLFGANLNAASGGETLSVEFAVESKSTVFLDTATEYNGWDHDDNAAIYVSIENLDVDKVYSLVISMDPIVYVPVETLPAPSGATTSFVKNTDLKVNGSEDLELKDFSGTITYTFNEGDDKTLEIENFKLQLDFDEVLWNKLAGSKLKVRSENLLSVKLVEGENTIDTKNLVDATTTKNGTSNLYSGIKLSTASTYTTMPNVVVGQIDNKFDWIISMSGGTSGFEGQYFRKITIEITLPSITIDGVKYFMKYDLNDFTLYCQFKGVVDKSLYTIEASDEKLVFEMDNYYFKNKGFIKGKFTFPQDKLFTDNQAEYNFAGNVNLYCDDNPSSTVCERQFNASLNTLEGANLKTHQMGSSSTSSPTYKVYPSYYTPDVVQRVGGFGLSNSGAFSGRLKISILFDNNLKDEERVLVTTLTLMPDYFSDTITITYSLIDENSNLIYFDSEGNVVPKGTAGAQTTWHVTIDNEYYGETKHAERNNILFNRSMLRSDHQDYFFHTIEYIHGGIPENHQYWNGQWSQGYYNSPGTFWGYTKTTESGKSVYSTVDVYKEVSQNEFVKDEDLCVKWITRTTSTKTTPLGLRDPEVSKTSINAGDTFTLSFTAFVVSYPYTYCNVVNTENSNLIFGFKMPAGVTINESGTIIKNFDNTKNIPIADIRYKAINSEYNLWIIELQGGDEYAIGYAREDLTHLPTGDSVNCTIEFNTPLSLSNSTISFLSSTFVCANGYINSPGGSNQYYKQVDAYDLNNNGRVDDNVGGFSSKNDGSFSLQIVEKIAQLEVTDGFSINGVASIDKTTIVNDNTDIIEYQLKVECTSGGSADEFAYYIPIIKNNSAVDNQLVFSAEYAYILTKEVEVINSVEGIGVKVLYGFDPTITFDEANSSTAVWYETIPADKTLDDVAIIKIVPQSTSIENGSISVVKVSMKYAGSADDYIKDAGMSNIWVSRGQYRYKIGDRAVVGLYSTDETTISTHYTYAQQTITLKTSTGTHNDNVGNDIKVLDGIYSFKNDQTFEIVSVKLHNVKLSSVINMEFNGEASTLTGDDANRTFAFYAQLDENGKKDISDSTCVLGTVAANNPFDITFEIFNADVISDTTTNRYVDLVVESNNGVTIPIRIIIERELTVIGEVSNSIISGKQYLLLPSDGKGVTISKDSAFTAQFSAENLIPDNYLSRKIVFTTPLPANTTITLIDWTDANNLKYYYYKTTASETTTIELTSFYVMGSNVNKFINSTGNTAITEKLLFIVDLADGNSLEANSTNTINLVRVLKSTVEEASPDTLSYTVKENRTFELTTVSEKAMGKEIEVEYVVSDIDYSDSNYNDQKLALSIKPISNLPVSDSELVYEGKTYYLNSNGEFIIPLDNVQKAGTYTIKFTFYSEYINYHNGTCDLEVNLLASATASADRPNLGKKLQGKIITLTNEVIPSIKIENMKNRWVTKEDINDIIYVSYVTSNITGKITIELQQKISEGYVTNSTLLEAVNDNTTQVGGKFDITNDRRLGLKFSNLIKEGYYQVLICVYDEKDNIITSVSYKFMVIE